jgi:hypothetical protein
MKQVLEPAMVGGLQDQEMHTQSKPAAIDTRQIALEMLGLAGRAFAVGVAVSVVAAALIVGLVTLVS